MILHYVKEDFLSADKYRAIDLKKSNGPLDKKLNRKEMISIYLRIFIDLLHSISRLEFVQLRSVFFYLIELPPRVIRRYAGRSGRQKNIERRDVKALSRCLFLCTRGPSRPENARGERYSAVWIDRRDRDEESATNELSLAVSVSSGWPLYQNRHGLSGSGLSLAYTTIAGKSDH